MDGWMGEEIERARKSMRASKQADEWLGGRARARAHAATQLTLILLGVLIPWRLLLIFLVEPGLLLGRLLLGGLVLGLVRILLLLALILLLVQPFLLLSLLLLLAQLQNLEGILVLVEGERELIGDGYAVGVLHDCVSVGGDMSSLNRGSDVIFLATLEPLCNRDIQLIPIWPSRIPSARGKEA
jgi:hypothetical protein